MHLAGSLHLQPRDDAQQRRLAAARRAEKTDKLALADVQVDVLQRGEAAELLADVAQVQKSVVVHAWGHALATVGLPGRGIDGSSMQANAAEPALPGRRRCPLEGGSGYTK
jgi:hypothetical protein